MTEAQTTWEQRKKQQALALMGAGPGLPAEDCEAEQRVYSLTTEEGLRLYETFSDEELLELLRNAARRLGRSPSQDEVHWILRDYLRARFKNWPGALRAAGLSRAAGRNGTSMECASQKEEEYRTMLEQVRETARALGRIPHPSELPEVCRSLKKRHRNWGEVLAAAGAEDAAAAGLQKAEDLSPEEQRMLEELRAIAEDLNRAPLRSEVAQSLREALLRRFGSWRRVLFQIDLEPVRRITPFVNAPLLRSKDKQRATHRKELYDCHYRLLKPDPQTAADLQLVQTLARQLGRPPSRREVPPDVRKRLQTACGSWSNALFQLGLQEKP